MESRSDIGSTTIKCVVLDEHDTLLYSTYERHYSHILKRRRSCCAASMPSSCTVRRALLSITSGSAGLVWPTAAACPLCRRYSLRVAVKHEATDCVIELGVRMPRSRFDQRYRGAHERQLCAGGTGAFIDQMATLLKMGADEMNKAAENAQRTYNSRPAAACLPRVTQPLINQGTALRTLLPAFIRLWSTRPLCRPCTGPSHQGQYPVSAARSPSAACCARALTKRAGTTGTCPENSLP